MNYYFLYVAIKTLCDLLCKLFFYRKTSIMKPIRVLHIDRKLLLASLSQTPPLTARHPRSKLSVHSFPKKKHIFQAIEYPIATNLNATHKSIYNTNCTNQLQINYKSINRYTRRRRKLTQKAYFYVFFLFFREDFE